MFPLPLLVTIGNSQRLRLFLATSHASCAVALFLAALPPLSQWAGMILLLFSLAYYWRPAQEVRLRGDRDGNLEIWRANQWQMVRLAGSSVVLPGCTVLRMAIANQWLKRNLVILPDSLPTDDFRRLRVWLRWRESRSTSQRATTKMPVQ